MRKDAILTLAAGLLMSLAVAAPASHARPVIGMGDQKPAMFSDTRFDWLNLTYARIVVAWDMRKVAHEGPYVDNWLQRARAAKVRPLVAFGHSRVGSRKRVLPTVAQYRREVRAFRKRYPWVREYTPWNEVNHCSQPTCNRPERAAAYYKVIKQECPGCTVLAADVLDQRNMVPWLRRFTRAARPYKPRLWGLHNYLDANRRRSSGTRHLLSAVEGQVWFTETGGVVRRLHYRSKISFPESVEHAAESTAWVLKLATDNPRVRRVYFYHWNADSPDQSWDSGFIDPTGKPRPAFDVLARFRGRDPAKTPWNFGFGPPGPAPPPGYATPAPESQGKPAPPAPQPAPAPTDPCFVTVTCGVSRLFQNVDGGR